MKNNKNYSSCILAGGCFWCISMPYYNKKGIIEVISGYTGGIESDAIYEKVTSQQTLHRECIKIIYDSSLISYNEILDIYFEAVNPFDEGGQFIDRGLSYTLALYYQDEKMKQIILDCIHKIEKETNRQVAISVTKEIKFYKAEEYHQDYAIKNPNLMEEELQKSGRKSPKLHLK